jgi:hypothetical protein
VNVSPESTNREILVVTRTGFAVTRTDFAVTRPGFAAAM